MNQSMLACLLLSCALLFTFVASHGLLCEPRQRGAITLVNVGGGKIRPITKMRFPRDSVDWFPHFPSGVKNEDPGSGLASQRRAGKWNWTPYEPTAKGFVFRAGVCGDKKWGYGPQDHLKGGRYYFPRKSPFIVRTYRQGGIMSASVALTAHHNGYYEFTICDVSRCRGGDISEECLRNHNKCRKLKRQWEKRCETGFSQSCAPIDPNYPTRWYLPCSTVYPRSIYERQWHINFHLPSDLVCKHCVIQWYWVGANACNPPGITEYFRGPRGPSWWGDCRGQGNARGGYRPWSMCGGKNFPEEYYACADVRILPNRALSRVRAPYKYVPKGHNPIRYVQVYVAGKSVGRVENGGKFWYPAGNRPTTFEAIPFNGAKAPQFVFFAVEGIEKRWLEWRAPYIFLGNKGRKFGMGRTMVRDRWFWVQITSSNRFGRLHFTTIQLFFGSERK